MPIKYLRALPRHAPAEGRVIVHNCVHAEFEDQWPGSNGFRAWTQRPNEAPKIKRCDCGWSGLPHYRGPEQPGGYGNPPSVKGKRFMSKRPYVRSGRYRRKYLLEFLQSLEPGAFADQVKAAAEAHFQEATGYNLNEI
jgi:hypothetical protein